MNDVIAYRVGTNYIYNIYPALLESMQTGKPVEFYCNDHMYDQYDWTKEPEPSLDELMTAYAHRLRSQYERVILLWSGGTDSHTIYNIFRRANIRIDEIIIKASAHLAQYPDHHVDWMRANHWDPTTRITRYDQNDTELRAIDCADENWVWKPKGDLGMFGMSTGAEGVKHLIERNHAGKTWTAVAGYEKPRLIYRKGRWYARHLDSPMRQTMSYDHLTLFFLEPLINIKQNHLVKHAVKKRIAQNNLPLYDGDMAESKWCMAPKEHRALNEAKWSMTPQGYHGWATACGRHEELTYGASNLQKLRSDEYFSIDITQERSYRELISSTDPTLQAFVKNQDSTALNYVKGLFNLATDKKFMEFVNNGYLSQPNRLLNPKLLFSKEYDLGA